MKTRILLAIALVCALLPAGAQPWAKAMLEQSPRHGEWVDVTNGTRVVHCYVVYPEVKKHAAAVIVVHEIFGLTDWARNAADEMAAAGYIAIAPDLLTGAGPNGGDSRAFPSTDDAVAAIHNLPQDQITGDLNAAANYVKTLPAANGKIAVAGFCWGGAQAFRFACNRPDLKAALVFYGTPPTESDMAKIKCPVYGFYAGNDARVTATVPGTEKSMKSLGKIYKPAIYDGAGHGFMRAGEQPGPEPGNKKAHDDAWKRLKSLLGKI